MLATKTWGLTATFAMFGATGLVCAQAPAKTSQDQPTFARDVAPILQRSCQPCHRPGNIAPMSLLTYQEARPWARAMKQQVVQRNMPPWYIDRAVGIRQFKNDPSLSDQEIPTISAWVPRYAGTPYPSQFIQLPDRIVREIPGNRGRTTRST